MIALLQNYKQLQPDRNAIGQSFVELSQVDSTNNYATALAHAGLAQHGMVVFAHEQLKGKGQRNKKWLAQKGENITLSIVIQPEQLSLSQFFLLSMCFALGAQQFFKQYAGNETKVKWPNDIFWCDRKAGGILIENIIAGIQWKYAIVGIGLNINQTSFAGISQNAVSLKQISTKEFNVIAMAREMCDVLENYYKKINEDPAFILQNYHQHLYKRNEWVKLKKENKVFEALIKGVSSTGQLITEHGTEELFDVGEVEWII
jgi:BirA family biotin operon repressor/biotin-[acetyl-CoA-carboxylase] ligase